MASIAAKELLPNTVAVWDYGWVGKAVWCHCDNQAVVAAIKVIVNIQLWPICCDVCFF